MRSFKNVIIHPSALILSLLILQPSAFILADWIAVPLAPVYTPPATAVTLTATGAVTRAAAAPASAERWLTSATLSGILPSTGTVALASITASGATTNTLATLTNGVAASLNAGWFGPTDILRITRGNGATNLPSVALTCWQSPVTTNIAWLSQDDAWKLHTAAPAVLPIPYGSGNGLALVAVTAYAGTATTNTLNTFTNAAAYTPSAALWLLPGDRLDLTATRVTNAVPLRAVTERQRL